MREFDLLNVNNNNKEKQCGTAMLFVQIYIFFGRGRAEEEGKQLKLSILFTCHICPTSLPDKNISKFFLVK